VKRTWTECNVGIANRRPEPDRLLIGTVFHKAVLSETVCVALYKAQLGIIKARGSLKLRERSGDQARGSGGGVTGPMALELLYRMDIDGIRARITTHDVDL
jgi:hypothetical protein